MRYAGEQIVEDTTTIRENRQEKLAYRKVAKGERIKAGAMITQLCRFKDLQVKNQNVTTSPF